ncbi:MAG: OFA family MFS transporter, partial [Clostridiales bacterium]|nr:OFA family MFS transporter [Clostridiales bacterium]
TASYGISSVIIPPVAKALITNISVTAAFKILGAAFIVIVCIASLFVTKCPENFIPAGWTPPVEKDGAKGAGKMKKVADKDWRGMLSDPAFYVMILLLMCGAIFGMMLISQASPMAQKMMGMSVTTAMIIVSILALFNGTGRVGAGFVSDRIGRVNTLIIMLVVALVAMGMLYTSNEGTVMRFYIGIALIGLCFGSFMGVFPGFTADQFGARNNSMNYGIMFIGYALAGLVGPQIVTRVYSASESYRPVFMIGMCFAVAGLVLAFVFKAMEKSGKRSEEAENNAFAAISEKKLGNISTQPE